MADRESDEVAAAQLIEVTYGVPELMAEGLIGADAEYWEAYYEFMREHHSDAVCRRICAAQTRLIKAAKTVAAELKYRREG